MPADDTFEDDLLYAISRTGDAFQAPQAPLLAGGLQRGRRRWRRRSAVAIAGGATALALIGTGGVYLAGLGGPAAPAAPAGSGASGRGDASTGPTVTPSAAASAPVAPVTPVSGDEMVALLKALLPKGGTSVLDSRGTDGKPSGAAGADVVFDDGRGQAQIGVSVQRRSPEQLRREDDKCPDQKFVPYDGCTSSTLPDGSTLTVLQGYEYPDRRADTKDWTATLVRPDGGVVSVNEWNAPAEKGRPVSRPNPPLTVAQLTALVTDRSWDKVVAGIVVTAEPPTPVLVKEYTAEEILSITAGLLPAGLTETETDGQDGYANFVVNDGRGKSMVELNVQDWSGQHGLDQHFAGVQPLPDGTRVVTQHQGGMWTVDTLRKDGLRVVISAYNREGPNKPATRSTPALTDAQLQAVATSALWQLKK
ncbi:hypothetical protein [Kitasatospora sp. NBC_00315]|uniref:hypothetical protein n=1 Tax=Kitasatospora sp. NBC_00315 TaxID=2975963 RepID=UPI0032468DE1